MTKENLNYYEKALQDFEHFCDDFENAATKRYAGVDDGSTATIDTNTVERATPEVVREIDELGETSEEFREPPINVQATYVGGVLDSDSDTE
tara:strand:- start:107 stop:382 length:276 start_codon:yes stop_codon:yes gene_type:complete